MPGSEIVCANMIAWEKLCFAMSKAFFNIHVEKAHTWAKNNHPYQTQTGGSEHDLYHHVSGSGLKIEGEVGYMSFPTAGALGTAGSKGWWLENPNNNVYPYGNKNATPFGGRFKVLEQAIQNDIGVLFGQIAALYGGGIKGVFRGGHL